MAPRDGVVQSLSRGLCRRIAVRNPGRGKLLIAHGSVFRDAAAGDEANPVLGLNLSLRHGARQEAAVSGPVLECASDALPFVDGAFHHVTLFHVLADGREDELEEACRVLAPGGDLVIVGISRMSWTGLDGRHAPDLPRIQRGRLHRQLDLRGMAVEGICGAGLMGRSRPRVIGTGWWRLVLPVADVVLLHARHRQRPTAIRPRLKDVPAGLAPTAIAGR